MKRKLLFALALKLTLGASAQGTLNVGNNVTGVFRAPLYTGNPANPYESLAGQSSLGLPSGTTVYPGALLQGSGYTFAVYYGWATVTHPQELVFLVATTFRTATANVLPAGLIRTVTDVVVPGVPPGARAKLQVRVWNNLGGTVMSYETATSRSASALFLSEPLGGMSTGGPILTPDMVGWSSFNIYPYIPEPSIVAMGAMAGWGAVVMRGMRTHRWRSR